MEQKRLLIALVLSFIVLYGFRTFYPAPPAKDNKAAVEQKAAAPAAAAPAPPKPAPAAPEGPAGTADMQATEDKVVTVETKLYIASVSNVGGVLKSFRLKEYLDSEGKPTE